MLVDKSIRRINRRKFFQTKIRRVMFIAELGKYFPVAAFLTI
jgi:hypothetical protein